MPDIEALIAELRTIAEIAEPPAELLTEAADALERQQAVVEAARKIPHVQALTNALAALDARPEDEFKSEALAEARRLAEENG